MDPQSRMPLETEAVGLHLGPATLDLPVNLFEIPPKMMTIMPTQYYLLREVFPDHCIRNSPPSPALSFLEKSFIET